MNDRYNSNGRSSYAPRRDMGVQNPQRRANPQDSRRYAGAPRNGYRYGAERSSAYGRADDRRRAQAPRPAAQRTARPVGQARPMQQPPRRPAPRRNGGNGFKKVLRGIGMVFFAIFAGIAGLFSALNRKLDVFRKGEASTVIVNTILSGVVVVILLCVFMLCKPGLDASRARSQAARGNADTALKLVHALEADEYPAEKLNSTRVSVVEGLIASGRYDAAASLISEMPEGETRQELSRRNSYAEAGSLYESGEYAAAAQLFYQIEDYQDSALRYADCRCALAIEAYQRGDESSARSLLLDVPDVVERVSTAALKVSGSAEGAQQILAAPLFQAANLTEMARTMQEINAARSDMPNGRIAAGRYHTVGLKSDGTLTAVGDNSVNQLGVGNWTGITQVAAGAFHTVGLKSDGTVLATGDNSQGQCDVSGWTDIVAIAASTCDTIGLKRDGTVVACGKNSSLTSGWHNATFVTGGSYSMGCLYDNGAMLSTHASAQMDMGVVLYDLSVCGQVSVGILYDGTMVSTYEGAPRWTDMVSATACETGILGIDVNGQVKSHFYRAGDAVEISVPGEAVEVESSGTHHVVLTSDGRVYAFGNNDYGQCGVSGWQL